MQDKSKYKKSQCLIYQCSWVCLDFRSGGYFSTTLSGKYIVNMLGNAEEQKNVKKQPGFRTYLGKPSEKRKFPNKADWL